MLYFTPLVIHKECYNSREEFSHTQDSLVDHCTLVSDGGAGAARERIVSLERLDEYAQAMSALAAAIDEPSASGGSASCFDSELFCRTLLAGVCTVLYLVNYLSIWRTIKEFAALVMIICNNSISKSKE